MNTNVIPLRNFNAAPKISVIMVSYMTGPALLESLQAAMSCSDVAEIILVDNGNTAQERRGLSQLVLANDKIRLLQGHGNIGFAAGCNYGAKLAGGEYFLFLNPDAIISPGSAKKLSQAGANLNRPWIAGGLLRDIHGREQRGSRRHELTPLRAFATFTGLHKLPGLTAVHRENEILPNEPCPMPVISGAFMMTDRASFQQIDGFDERYFLHVEDIDICRRARLAGGQVYFVPGASVMHYGSTSRVPRQKVEKEKLKGFIIYFWRYSDKKWAKLLTLLATPFMGAAIMGRAWYLSLRAVFTGR